MTPRAAATVILMRDRERALELLMVRRTLGARFMAGFWVFPGGALDAADGDGQAGLRRAAARELEEEAAVSLPDGWELVPFARWITPARSPIRFDTWFYLAAAPAAADPRVDAVEIVDWRWITPAAGLAAFRSGELELALPTEKQLELLSGLCSVEAALAHARARVEQITPIEPRIEGGRIVRD
ncbi:MAG: NUDIX domain-containing protein [Acidobacteriota bacterium]|nr:NUDIX domain-containing protein [Acidobacteriota bacterium]